MNEHTLDLKAPVTKCLFPAAGLGTRFLPATKETPKEMLPLVDRPIIAYGVEEAVASGCADVIIITGRTKRSMEDYFDRSWELEAMLRQRGKDDLLAIVRNVSEGKKIVFARQPEPLGLGHAVNCGEPFCRNDFFGVILPDDVMIGEPPVLSQLIAVHDRLGGSVIALEEVSENDTSRYGIVAAESAGDGVYRILDLVEKPGPQNAPSRLAIMGRYILSPSIFRLIERVRPGAGGEIQLTDAIRLLADQEPVWGVVYSGTRLDCGTQSGWLYANVRMAMKDPVLRKVIENAIS